MPTSSLPLPKARRGGTDTKAMRYVTNHQAKFFAHALTRAGGEGIEHLGRSLLNAAVDLNPHQIEAALFALHYPLSKAMSLS